jgi:hypothetical protein
MKTYVLDIIPRIKRYSKRLDDLTALTDKSWVAIDDIGTPKTVYIFRAGNELLISRNGIVARGNWEYLQGNSLVITMNNESYLLKHGFFDDDFLILKRDGTQEFALFVRENESDDIIFTINQINEVLKNKYLKNVVPLPAPPDNIFETDKGTIQVELSFPNARPDIGNKVVMMNGGVAVDGVYKIRFMFRIKVKDGVIVDFV